MKYKRNIRSNSVLNSKACKTVLSLYQNHTKKRTKTIPKPYQKPYQKPMVFWCQIGFKNEPGLTSKSNQKPNQKIRIQCTTVYTKVEADIDVFWFDFDIKPGSFLKPIWHKKTIGFWYDFWYGFGMVLVWFWYGFGMV